MNFLIFPGAKGLNWLLGVNIYHMIYAKKVMMLETTESKMGNSGNLLRTYQKLKETHGGIIGETWGKIWGTVGEPTEEIGGKPCHQHHQQAKLGDAMRLTDAVSYILNLSCQRQIKTQLTFSRTIICKDKTTSSATSNESFPESVFQSYVNIHFWLQIYLPLMKT